MCELLGMSARYPTTVNHSLALLRPRGGEIGPHADGWGVAFYQGRAARVFKEPIPAAESRCLGFIAEYDFRSSLVIGHIRKANPPQFGRAAANTHPFSRELWGRSWVFAHNGKLPTVKDDPAFALERFRPMGDTDSEHAFCYLMDRLGHAGEERVQGPDDLVAALAEPIARLGALGELNLLMSDGVHLLAFANTRLQQVRRTCLQEHCEQTVVLVATAPLTDEPWRPLDLGRLYVFAGGAEVQRAAAAA
jgi:glutamine amidotransferase